ncbi:MAG: hypothetical protein SFX72_09030 [Isosphaeraceae bacterium]|nr:hypothetical protein [Isosphaeraceae bacterium]
MPPLRRRLFPGIRSRLCSVLLLAAFLATEAGGAARAAERRLLYVAEPGIRNYLEYGGHGVLVFDIDAGHRFVKRIPTSGVDATGKPLNVKGINAHAGTARLYVGTTETITCIDLITEKILWERRYEGGCDRSALSPDGKILYVPSFEKDHWNVVDTDRGDVIAKIVPKSGSHNTVYGSDGAFVYLAGLRSPLLTVAETKTHSAHRTVGPFSAAIRPFTVNANQTLVFVNVNGLLGFEVGDLGTGKMIHRIEVPGFSPGPVKRHGCPSHGIGLTPDESEIWVVDGHNKRVHLYDVRSMPPKYLESLEVRDEPGWVTFSILGDLAYPSTGDVFETKSRKRVAQLTDEEGRTVMSEKMLEIDFDGPKPVRAGDQFGVGRAR